MPGAARPGAARRGWRVPGPEPRGQAGGRRLARPPGTGLPPGTVPLFTGRLSRWRERHAQHSLCSIRAGGPRRFANKRPAALGRVPPSAPVTVGASGGGHPSSCDKNPLIRWFLSHNNSSHMLGALMLFLGLARRRPGARQAERHGGRQGIWSALAERGDAGGKGRLAERGDAGGAGVTGGAGGCIRGGCCCRGGRCRPRRRAWRSPRRRRCCGPGGCRQAARSQRRRRPG